MAFELASLKTSVSKSIVYVFVSVVFVAFMPQTESGEFQKRDPGQSCDLGDIVALLPVGREGKVRGVGEMRGWSRHDWRHHHVGTHSQIVACHILNFSGVTQE